MKAYTRISLPVIKLNVSSPEGDDKKQGKLNKRKMEHRHTQFRKHVYITHIYIYYPPESN
jgi:hypothetical protein